MRPATTYQWVATREYSVDANAIGNMLVALEARDGVATPEAFVELAADPASPAHGMLEWDDAKAGHSWRVHQARKVISGLRIVGSDKPAVPAFLSVRICSPDDTAEYRGYASQAHVAADEALQQYVLAEARGQLLALRRKYGQLQQLATVWQAVDAISEATG